MQDFRILPDNAIPHVVSFGVPEACLDILLQLAELKVRLAVNSGFDIVKRDRAFDEIVVVWERLFLRKFPECR